MSLGTEIGLSPGDIMLDGNPCLLWQIGWMDQDATWYGGSLCALDTVLDDTCR